MKADVVSGALTIAIGAIVAIFSAQYRLGTLGAMGSGYFPMVLSILLIILGLILLVGGLGRPGESFSIPSIKAAVFILCAPLVFALLVNRFGFVVAIVAVGLLGAFAHKEGTYTEKILTVFGVTLAALIVFSWGIKLPISLFLWEVR